MDLTNQLNQKRGYSELGEIRSDNAQDAHIEY